MCAVGACRNSISPASNYDCPERVVNYNVEVRCLRRDLCLPLSEAQDGRMMLGCNNSAQFITYSMEASNGGFIGRGCGTVL